MLSLYKLLAKVLANKLNKVIARVVLYSQNAIVQGRQILNATLIANKAIGSRLRSQRGGMICKLGIEKAYDHVKWTFLLEVLQNMGFGQRWVYWIRFCISTARFSILVNGPPIGFF